MINQTKLLITSIVSTFIFGCATVRQYDPVEYNYSIISAVAASRAINQCHDRNSDSFKRYISDINDATMHLQEYERFAKNNNVTYVGTVELRKIVLGFVMSEDHSHQYCVYKLSEIQNASRVMAKTFGKQTENTHLCSSTIKSRYNLYRDSYVYGRITKEEFYDLVDDLIRMATLKKLNNVSCTNQELKELDSVVKSISQIYSVAAVL